MGGGGSLAIDDADNELIVGVYSQTIDFGGGPLPLPDPAKTRAIVAKLDSSGGALWSKSYGSTGRLELGPACADAAGNTFLSGHFEGTSELGSGPTVFVARLDPSGKLAWIKTWAPTAAPGGLPILASAGVQVQVDAAGELVVAGGLGYTDAQHQGYAAVPASDFGGAPLDPAATSVLAKLDPNGNLLWTKGLTAADGAPFGTPIKTDDRGRGLANLAAPGGKERVLRQRRPRRGVHAGDAGLGRVAPARVFVHEARPGDLRGERGSRLGVGQQRPDLVRFQYALVPWPGAADLDAMTNTASDQRKKLVDQLKKSFAPAKKQATDRCREAVDLLHAFSAAFARITSPMNASFWGQAIRGREEGKAVRDAGSEMAA